MYKELLIHPECLREKSVLPWCARQLAAAACDAFPVDPAIFQRGADGKNLQAVYGRVDDGEGWGVPPKIFFGGGKGFLRITGLGEEGVRLLDAEAATLATAIANYLGSPYTFRLNQGECTVSRSRPTLYRINNLALSKKMPVINAHRGSNGNKCTLESVEPLIRRAIIGGIVSQARYLGLEREIGTDDMLGLRILDGAPTMMRIKKEVRLHALVVGNLVFSIDLDLNGPWLAGTLRSRGFGLIRRKRF